MFVVTIDVWPHGRCDAAYTQTRVAACNDGTGDLKRGNYQAVVVPAGLVGFEVVQFLTDEMVACRTARVQAFPRGRSQAHLPALCAALFEALGLTEIQVESEGART